MVVRTPVSHARSPRRRLYNLARGAIRQSERALLDEIVAEDKLQQREQWVSKLSATSTRPELSVLEWLQLPPRRHHITGKGNKDRTITVSIAVLDAVKRYRKARDLSPALPSLNEPAPLIPKTRGKGPVTSTRWIPIAASATCRVRRSRFENIE